MFIRFFTPQHVSKLIAQLAMHGQNPVNKIYDPAAGSGSLLLQAVFPKRLLVVSKSANRPLMSTSDG
jgi:hypothetical protein